MPHNSFILALIAAYFAVVKDGRPYLRPGKVAAVKVIAVDAVAAEQPSIVAQTASDVSKDGADRASGRNPTNTPPEAGQNSPGYGDAPGSVHACALPPRNC